MRAYIFSWDIKFFLFLTGEENVYTQIAPISSKDQISLSNQQPIENVEIPNKIVRLACDWGIGVALDKLAEEKMENACPAILAITLMEKLFQLGFREKVWIFVKTGGLNLNSVQNNTLKAELYIRLGDLLDDNLCRNYQNLAIDLLNSGTPCTHSALKQLAHQFVKKGNGAQAIHWLSKTDASREDYRKEVALLFKQSLFEEGNPITRLMQGKMRQPHLSGKWNWIINSSNSR